MVWNDIVVSPELTLLFEDGSTSVYEFPGFHRDLYNIFRLLEKRDSEGNLIVKYDDWSESYPMTITYGDGKVISGEWEYATMNNALDEEEEVTVLKYTDWKDREFEYVVGNSGIYSYKDPEDNYLEFEYDSGEAEFFGPATIAYNGEIQASYKGATNDSTRVGTEEFPNGHTIGYNYDYIDGVVTKTFDEDKTSDYTFNSEGKVTSYTGIDGKTSIITYNDEGEVTQSTSYNCGVGTEEYTYDENGNVLTYTDKMDNVTTYEYNDPNNPDKATKTISPAPFNYETTFTYDADEGWLLTMTDPLGRTTTYTYYTEGVKKGKTKTVTDSLSRVTEYDYDDWGYIKWIKDYLDRYSYFWYDQDGNLQKQTDIYGNTTTYYRDENDNPIMIKDSDGDITRFEYDDDGRLIKTITPDGSISVIYYNDEGLVVTATDSNGNTSRKEYDETGRVVRVVDAKGYITSFEYDNWGNLTKIIDPMLRERTYEYDTQGRMTKMTDPMGRETLYSCDEYCSVNTVVDPNGWTTKYHNNVKCQLTKIEFNDGSFYQFTYDELGRKTSETGAGNLYGENVYGGVFYGEKDYGAFKYEDKVYYGFDPANTIYYEYDAADRLTKISYPDPGGSSIRKDISYEYYDDDKIKKISDIAGNDRVYSYDSQDRLTTVTMCGKTVTYHYDDSNYGRMDYVLLPDGVKREYVYDDENTLITKKYTKDNGNTVLYQFDSIYNIEGLLTSKTVTNPSGVKTKSSFNYDAIKRLVNVMENGIQKTWFDYDPVGNILKEITPDTIDNYDYNANNEKICHNGIRYEYDLNGNVTAEDDPVKGRIEYVYYYNNALAKIKYPDNTEDQFFYDAAGQLIHKIDKTGKNTCYYYDNRADEAINETDESGNVTLVVFPGIGYKSVYNNNEWRYFIKGSGVFALMDGSGNVTDRYGFETKGNSFNPFLNKKATTLLKSSLKHNLSYIEKYIITNCMFWIGTGEYIRSLTWPKECPDGTAVKDSILHCVANCRITKCIIDSIVALDTFFPSGMWLEAVFFLQKRMKGIIDEQISKGKYFEEFQHTYYYRKNKSSFPTRDTLEDIVANEFGIKVAMKGGDCLKGCCCKSMKDTVG